MKNEASESEKLKRNLGKCWIRKLYLWWDHYNEEYLSSALNRPLIGLGRGEVILGSWDGMRKVLTISYRHIQEDVWLEVMETLRHEMAHQYVDEILRVTNQAPHGEAFCKACKMLRCSPHSRLMRSDRLVRQRADDRVLRVLKKVLSLASSPNEHEAHTAVQKAQHLLVKYNIDLVELDRERSFETRCLGEVKARRTSAELWLASLLNRFFFVEVIWTQSYDPRRDRTGSILQIYGTSQNLEMAEYVFGYLFTLLDGLWESYKVEAGIQSNAERQRYFSGVLEGFYRKLENQEKWLEKTQALVWKGDTQLKAFYQYLNPRVEKRYRTGVSPTEAYAHGFRKGHQVTIHRPISRVVVEKGRVLEE